VLLPASRIAQETIIKTMQEISPEHLETMRRGVRIFNRWVRPICVQKIRRGTFKIAVWEGKKHDVRILVERAGLRILDMKRIRIGRLVLGSLAEGDYRELNERERALIFQNPSK
jgi:23S rRNA pseudouridine2605 synthase